MKKLLILAVLAQTTLTFANDNNCMLLNFFEHDRNGHGNIDIEDGYAIRDLEKANGSVNFLRYIVNSNADLQNQLSFFDKDREKLKCLHIASHGGNNSIGPVIANEGDFLMNLNIKSEVEENFGSIKGAFAKNAHIVFSGCELIDQELSSDKVLEQMYKFAEYIGFESGSIYMNKTMGLRATETMFMQGPWDNLDHPDRTIPAIQAFALLTTPVSFPVSLIAERAIFNKGYMLIKEGKNALILPQNFFRARKRNLSFSTANFVIRGELGKFKVVGDKLVHVLGTAYVVKNKEIIKKFNAQYPNNFLK